MGLVVIGVVHVPVLDDLDVLPEALYVYFTYFSRDLILGSQSIGHSEQLLILRNLFEVEGVEIQGVNVFLKVVRQLRLSHVLD